MVVDYAGRKEYRIFVATEGGRIHGYLRDGSSLPGWNPKNGVGNIFLPMEHVLADGKDYLMAQTDEGLFHLYARNGDPRTPPVRWNSTFNNRFGVDISQLPHRIVSTNVDGTTFVTNFTGKYFNLESPVGSNQNVRFLFANVLGDERKETILLSQQDLAIYEHDQAQLEYQFPHIQDELFEVQLPNSEVSAIGTLSLGQQEIHLLDANGQLYPDFPLAGTTRFQIAHLFGDDRLILVVANGAEVYAYRLRL